MLRAISEESVRWEMTSPEIRVFPWKIRGRSRTPGWEGASEAARTSGAVPRPGSPLGMMKSSTMSRSLPLLTTEAKELGSPVCTSPTRKETLCPASPGEPAGPVGPVAPVAPRSPAEPWRPVGPVAPVAPRAPAKPWRPMGPVAPVAPVAPVPPVAPVAPVGPVGPVEPSIIRKRSARKKVSTGCRRLFPSGRRKSGK